MGWKFPYVSSFASDFNFDFDFAFTQEQMATGELAKMVAEADDWLKDRAENVGTDLASGMAESPGWNVFALEDGVVYHTYSRTAPDRFRSFLTTRSCSTKFPTDVTQTSRCAATTSTEHAAHRLAVTRSPPARPRHRGRASGSVSARCQVLHSRRPARARRKWARCLGAVSVLAFAHAPMCAESVTASRRRT